MTTSRRRKRASAGFFPLNALDGEGPLYRRLYNWFQRAIVEGRLQAGQRIPSSRSLAKELAISRIPVLTAYQQLHAEGYLETFTGAGTCVAAAIPQEAFKPVASPPRRAIRKAAAKFSARLDAVLSLVPDPEQPNAAFRVSQPALDHFPNEIWSSLLTRHSRHPARQHLAYGGPMGDLGFRQAIADYLGAARAVACEASQIMIVAGSQHGLQIATHALLNQGDRVWMEEPGYPGAHRAFAIAGIRVVPVAVDRDGLDVEAGMRRAPDARAAYITPSHQYPMGMTMSATRRMQLLNWAARAGSWIIEDDYDSEYRFAGHPIAALQGLGADDRVIYAGTFSKVLFPALRVGYLVIPKALVAGFAAARDAIDLFPSTLFQTALADFITEGHFARHIRRMRMLYMERRACLIAEIERQLGPRLQIVSAEAGLHLVGLLKPGLDDQAVSRQAAALGIAVLPLSMCHLEKPKRPGLILGYGGTDARQIEAGVRQLARIL
jgi:GntR family transcriptional regulator/MocR family aminotransferase